MEKKNPCSIILGKLYLCCLLAEALTGNLITVFRLSHMEKIFCREKLFSLSDKCIKIAGRQNQTGKKYFPSSKLN